MSASLAFSQQGCVTPPLADGPNDNCRVSAWSVWSGCTSPCGFGAAKRVRYEIAPAVGTGSCGPLFERALCDYRCGWCGDGKCLAEETCTSCPSDCGPCQEPGVVGNCVDEGVYALAFDDGPSPVYVQHRMVTRAGAPTQGKVLTDVGGCRTPALLDVLAVNNVKATFFVMGVQLENPNNVQTLKRAHAEGHFIAS